MMLLDITVAGADALSQCREEWPDRRYLADQGFEIVTARHSISIRYEVSRISLEIVPVAKFSWIRDSANSAGSEIRHL